MPVICQDAPADVERGAQSTAHAAEQSALGLGISPVDQARKQAEAGKPNTCLLQSTALIRASMATEQVQ